MQRPTSTASSKRVPHTPLRPRLLQPDAPLPQALPKSGLHHAINEQQVSVL